MNEIVLKANAKINLSLDVVGKRNDGYHELETVMCEIPLYDIVSVKKSDKIKVKCNLPYIPSDSRNIAFKAAEAFFKYTGIESGAEINIKKNIPVCAGLAGGSTDGAAVLKALNLIFDTDLSEEDLEKIGDTVGKDIPFCLRGGVCLAKGTGDKLTPIGEISDCYIVLVKPDKINVSTKDIFTKFDAEKTELHPYTSGIVEAIEKKDINTLARMMYNVLENVTSSVHPVICEIKNSFISDGAIGAVMSGSGPSVFAVFSDKTLAEKSFVSMKKTYKQTFLFDFFENNV